MDISSMLEVQMKVEMDIKENVIPERDQMPSTASATDPISQEESNFYKLMFGNDIASVRFRRIHCTACDVHIGSAPAQMCNMFEHPVLRTLLCSSCRDFYGDGRFEQGDDATDMFCRWCANGGNLYCCSYCSNTFCSKCIRRNFTSLVRKKIEADEKWRCFVCNPSDLYSARAMCWALIQHVQTVQRILRNDKKMSVEEIEDKMNLDESPCCPRRNKRKRRRPESSDEEDETYIPKPNGVPYVRRKVRRLKPGGHITYTDPNDIMARQIPYVNTQSQPIPIRPRPTSFQNEQSFTQIESPQTMSIKCEKSIVNPPETIILPSPSVINANNSLTSRYDSSIVQQQSLYHTTFMNTAGSSTYIQASPAMNTQTQIILSQPTSYQSLQPTSYQPQQLSSYQSSQSSQPMVSIPNATDKHGRSRYLFPNARELDVTLTPNIIELDSDSDDEPKIVEQRKDSRIDRNSMIDVNTAGVSSNKIVPVALTWENNDDDKAKEEQPLTEISTSRERNVSFTETMLPHSRKLDKLLSDTKEKMFSFFDLDKAIQDVEWVTQRRMKKFYYNMRDMVFQLSHINDRIMREYIDWRRSRKMQAESSTDESTSASREDVSLDEIKNEISLDMTCVNDSDTESDCERSECQILKPSEFVKNNNLVKDLLFFKKKLVNRSVGDDSVYSSADKAIQVYDVVSRDYEKCISYSMLMKTDDLKTDDSVVRPKATSDENFGKYEEQFIFYLQRVEEHDDRSIEIENVPSVEKTPLGKIDINSSFTSYLLQNLPLTSANQPDQLEQQINCRQERISKNHVNSVTEEIDTTASTIDKDKNKKIVDGSDSDIRIQETNMQLDEKLQDIHNNATNEEAILTLNNDDTTLNENGSDAINAQVTASIGNKENFAIIDD